MLTRAKLFMALGRLPGLQEVSPGLHLQPRMVTEINCSLHYLVFPSACAGWVVTGQAEEVVELIFGSFQRLVFVLGVIAGHSVADWLCFSLVLETFLPKPVCSLCLLTSTHFISMTIHLSSGV